MLRLPPWFVSGCLHFLNEDSAALVLARRILQGRGRASGSLSRLEDAVDPISCASEGSQLTVLTPFTSLDGVHLARSWEERETGAGKSGVGSRAKSPENGEKPPVQIPEAKNRGLVGAAGVRFGREGRPEAAEKSPEPPRDPGKRRVPPWRSEALCGHQATGKNLETCQSARTPAAT